MPPVYPEKQLYQITIVINMECVSAAIATRMIVEACANIEGVFALENVTTRLL